MRVPTILRVGGLRLVIYLNDHRPAHVHVIGAGRETVFELNCPDGPPKVREGAGYRSKELSTLTRVLWDRLAQLCEAWRSIHGDP